MKLFKLGSIGATIGLFLILLGTYPLWVVGESTQDQETGIGFLLAGSFFLFSGSLLVLLSNKD